MNHMLKIYSSLRPKNVDSTARYFNIMISLFTLFFLSLIILHTIKSYKLNNLENVFAS